MAIYRKAKKPATAKETTEAKGFVKSCSAPLVFDDWEALLPVFVADTAVPLALLVLFPEELVLEVELGAALVKARSCGSSPEPGVPAVPGPPPPCHTGMLEFSSAVDTAFHPF